MANISTIIDLIHPSNGEKGVVLGDKIWILFNQALDESRLHSGHLFLEGPSQHIISGPDVILAESDPMGLVNDDSIFQTSGYKDIIQGSLSFERISTSDLTTVSGVDTAGLGNLYRTKATLTPSEILKPNTTYNVYLAGDEDLSDALKTGITSRTVFDSVSGGANTGNGEAVFSGGYSGTVNDVYRIEVTTAGDMGTTTSGVVGTARFKWYRDTASMFVYDNILVSRETIELDNDVTVKFNVGTYDLGDTFYVVTKPPTYYLGNFLWSFDTGSGSIVAVPTATATTIIGTTPTPITSDVALDVVSMAPNHRDIQVKTSLDKIQVIFTNELDSSSITHKTVIVKAEPITGDENLVASKTVKTNLEASGNVLNIKLK